MSWLTEHVGGDNPTADRVLANPGAILGADVARRCIEAGLLDARVPGHVLTG